MEIYNLIRELYPICRSITGNGVMNTLNIINKHIPLNIKQEPSGKQFDSWTVPKEWNINTAYIKDKSGKKIIDFDNHNLHIVNYSVPINTVMKFKELKKNLHYIKNIPDAIPYITSYYKENWGFCLTYNQYLELEKLGDQEEYLVYIDSKLENGFLTYADLIIPGKSKKEILLSTYFCHPSMCHDNLSGLCLTVFLVKYLINNNNYYTYRIVFIPETIGSVIYIHNNYNELINNVIGGYVITHVGDSGTIKYLKTRLNDSFTDKVTIFALDELNINYEIRKFITCGSDERNYNFPNMDLNIGSIMKSKYTEYEEYHTSKDDLNFINSANLQNSYDIYLKCIYIIEKNMIYYTKFICEPFLTKFNLISTLSGQSYSSNFNATFIKKVLYYIDGYNDIISICNLVNESFDDVVKIIDILYTKKIIFHKLN